MLLLNIPSTALLYESINPYNYEKLIVLGVIGLGWILEEFTKVSCAHKGP
jgi:hypothetical protein